jgi:hypothetical protein
MEELTGATEVNAWTPDVAFADMIIGASFCGSKLSGVITAIDYDLAAGNGDVVSVRYSPVRTAQGPMGSCGCLSITSSTLAKYDITIRSYGDQDDLCGFSLWEAGPRTRDEILRTMAEALATKRDVDIWRALTLYGTSTKLSVYAKSSVSCNSTATEADCCAYKYAKSFYNSVVSVAAQLEGNCKHPDTVVMSPTVAKWFKIKDYTNSPDFLVNWGANGEVMSVAGLKVIVTGNATACGSGGKMSTASIMAVVLDSSRAIGEAWGKRPIFTEQYDNHCDKYRETIWMYWGTALLDSTAIAHIKNP